MNYKKLIADKNLTVEQLPKRLQKKINEIESVAQRVEELLKINLDESEKDMLFQAQVQVSSLDREIEKAVRKFNPFLYKKKLDHIARVNEQKLKDAEALKKAQTEYIETEKVEQIEEAEELEEQDHVETQDNIETIENEPRFQESDPEQEEFETNDVEQQLINLRSKINIKPESFIEEPSEAKDFDSSEAFDRVGVATPKKMSKGLILMGVGAFLLTWGAVNFFKERRS
ncbi:MAG: hypothetical protein FJZ56_02785 [Chlamydiae bacterium]|nr:hypothetical protein [Chlamydiota bacterium]